MKLCVRTPTEADSHTFVPYHDMGSARFNNQIHTRIWENPIIGTVAIDFRGNPIIFTNLTYYMTEFRFTGKSPSLSPALNSMQVKVVNHMIRYYRRPSWAFDDIAIFAPKFVDNNHVVRHYTINGSVYSHDLYNKVLSLSETSTLIFKSFKDSVKTAIKDCRSDLKELLTIQKEIKS